MKGHTELATLISQYQTRTGVLNRTLPGDRLTAELLDRAGRALADLAGEVCDWHGFIPCPVCKARKPLECKHFNARIEAASRIGHAWCPQCSKEVNLMEVFNNFLDALKGRLQG